jgi:four helix bundle protein
MFDFENLEVYKVSKELNVEIFQFLKSNFNLNSYLVNQLSRAVISMVINIAEGSGKPTNKSKRNFYSIARSSVYECVSLFDIMLAEKSIKLEEYQYYYSKFEVVSKMLFNLMKSIKDK